MANKFVSNLPLIEWTKNSLLKDKKRAILITSPSALKIAAPFLKKINIWETIFIKNSNKSYVDSLRLKDKTVKVAYLVGAGQVNDIGRYLAQKWQLETVSIPTAISADSFLVDCTGLRENDCVKYVKSKKADKVILDWQLLKKAPWKFHLSGCSDVLSIFTGLYDWRQAKDHYDYSVAIIAQGILDGLLSHSEAIKQKTKKGLEAIVNSLAMEVQLCNLYGNSRPEEGGEHFFTYCVENKMAHFLHGEMVGFAILLTGYLQNQNINPIKKFMDKIGLNYLPKGLTRTIVQETLIELPAYVKKHKLRSSVYNNFDYRKNQAKINQFFKFIKL
ncbi:iron-containing alcohol dehydrogenase [Patescibacteria group bacterium]|nr:iron-containing alcohol dehydrogenase [Patescibacteria group bacterium]MBU1499844.1 iron-containing alcohol dehydrogenase [Patescibacteria group bacterium]